MNHIIMQKEVLEQLRERYTAGTRVRLVKMNDPYTRLRPGDLGVVSTVDDAGTIHIKWDKGEGLGAVYGEDIVEIV